MNSDIVGEVKLKKNSSMAERLVLFSVQCLVLFTLHYYCASVLPTFRVFFLLITTVHVELSFHQRLAWDLLDLNDPSDPIWKI